MKKIFSRGTELGLLILAAVVFAITTVSLELSQGNILTMDVLYLIGGFIGVFTVAHLVLCFLAPHSDQLMLPIVSLLNGTGLVMLARLDLVNDGVLARRQVMWTIVGLILFVLVLVVLRDHRSLTRYSYILGAAGLILLALPLVWPQPPGVEARIWLWLGPFSIQPGEFSKIMLILFFAMLLTQKRSLFTVAGYRFLGLSLPRLRDLAPILVIWGIAIVIMGISNDFGPALLLFSTVLGMLFMATGRVSWLLIGLLLVGVGGFGIYQISSKIQTRFSNFLDPLGNYDNGGYQLSQALFGMSSGGISGTGLGQGHPEIVPVAHSDFILAGIGEEFGLIGLAAVLVMFGMLASRGFNTALKSRDSYGKLVASGLSLTLAVQVFVVTGGISAMLPMTGLTTPFMSAGGSSLMANYMLLAILLRISNAARRPARETSSNAPTDTSMFPAVQEATR
ncbi:FtsW/RodA/SpoVE family cell cycle protein [Corynebacterium simulans]|uniref:FtsW/RodA/SpoVE family cell cycle protein n=1 Tax=Corynebacterium TaxID=1716 RepID=UPI000783C93B|nr:MULTISPECIES: FtsW/RodA/SpoVE family cell cycle protein [Corynebacterium]HBC8576072.1 FtsW/RodA/SpoVE family cell cycle protein [Corynebacterium striatum]AMO89126.1 cell cycle family protein [Corynebacterium simulans]MDK7139057.1 FtsW/RodA/SpoVE family cell cycle protein [Corynebacterium simulans]OFT47906.1 cell division protein FtsW [Corynebacterium sp. HMSC06G04]OHO66243.1 cell division protein FtsW [Corynebacterium sp. HMSC036D03]